MTIVKTFYIFLLLTFSVGSFAFEGTESLTFQKTRLILWMDGVVKEKVQEKKKTVEYPEEIAVPLKEIIDNF